MFPSCFHRYIFWYPVHQFWKFFSKGFPCRKAPAAPALARKNQSPPKNPTGSCRWLDPCASEQSFRPLGWWNLSKQSMLKEWMDKICRSPSPGMYETPSWCRILITEFWRQKTTKLSCQSTQSSSQSLSWVKIHPVQAKICGLAKAPYKPTNTESAMYFWDCESQILHQSHIHPPIPSRTSRLEIVWMVRAWIFKDNNSTLEFPPFAFLSVLNDSCQVLWTHPKWVVSSF